MNTCISEAHSFARKAHVCSWCGEGIAAGEKYYRRSGVDEGKFWALRLHLDCRDAEETLPPGDRWWEGEPGSFRRGSVEEK
jgi:hypothetical protein